MSDERIIERLRIQVEACLDRNDLDGAVELLEQALAIDGEIADLHATLSMCLVDLGHVGLGRAEAEIAMSLDPTEALCHGALAHVLHAEGRRREALASLTMAIDLESELTFLYVMRARILRSLGEGGDEDLEAALEIDPEDVDALTAFSELEFARGDLDEAERHARAALEQDAGHAEALIAMGWVLLRRDDIEGARTHAAMAMQQNPRDDAALRLLVAAKARKSPVLGLWLRWAVYVSTLRDGKLVAILLGLYLVFRLAMLILDDLGLPDVAQVVRYVWWAIVAYSWFAPELFARMLRRELDSIELDPEY